MGNQPTYRKRRSCGLLDVRTELLLLLMGCLLLTLGLLFALEQHYARPINCGDINVLAIATNGQGGEAALGKALDAAGYSRVQNLHDAAIQAGIGDLPDPGYITACLETGGKRIATINGIQIKASPF